MLLEVSGIFVDSIGMACLLVEGDIGATSYFCFLGHALL